MINLQTAGVRGKLEANVLLGPRTTWRVGGPADWFFEPEDTQDLVFFLRNLPADIKVWFLGLGSNVLIRDCGLPGVVVHLGSGFSQRQRIDPHRVELGSGLACAQAARFCAAQGLAGAEFLAGIPGTIGGALAMNAGAWGGETWSLVEWVEMVDRSGSVHRRVREDFVTGYRSVDNPKREWFLRCGLRLEAGSTESSRKMIREFLRQRAEKQPTGVPSCGSVFRNPESVPAAVLIESLGLKGLRIGAAEVSRKHANFIIHSGEAKAEDIEKLICEIQQRIRSAYGVELQCEVKILGWERLPV